MNDAALDAIVAAAQHAVDRGALVVVVGPTASGKTELAVRLCERLGGEIISADSVQVYRDFELGSGKPTTEQHLRAPHHCVSVVDPLDAVDAKRFADLAESALLDVRSRGRVPVVCGGTFLWIKALLWGLAPGPSADAALRARHAALAAAEGRAALHRRLCEVDPESAARISPNDFVRVSRALEIVELTGRPQSASFAEHGFRRARHDAVLVGLECPREELDRRITARAADWLNAGWIDEVAALLVRGFGAARAMGSVGYKQVRANVEGRLPREALLAEIVRATRVLARRQRTWLRDQPVTWSPVE